MTQRAPALALAPAAFTEEERAARRRLLGGALLAAALLGAFAGMVAGRAML
jgi:hypothetical protein